MSLLRVDIPCPQYRRFGLENLRVLTGALEIVFGIGLLVGLWWLPAQVMAGFCRCSTAPW